MRDYLLRKIFHHFDARPAKHMEISNRTAKRLRNVKKSAISDHPLQVNWARNLNNASSLVTDYSKFKLLLRQSLFIKSYETILNKTIKSFTLRYFA